MFNVYTKGGHAPEIQRRGRGARIKRGRAPRFRAWRGSSPLIRLWGGSSPWREGQGGDNIYLARVLPLAWGSGGR